MQECRFDLLLVAATTSRFSFQIIDSLMESVGVRLTCGVTVINCRERLVISVLARCICWLTFVICLLIFQLLCNCKWLSPAVTADLTGLFHRPFTARHILHSSETTWVSPCSMCLVVFVAFMRGINNWRISILLADLIESVDEDWRFHLITLVPLQPFYPSDCYWYKPSWLGDPDSWTDYHKLFFCEANSPAQQFGIREYLGSVYMEMGDPR